MRVTLQPDGASTRAHEWVKPMLDPENEEVVVQAGENFMFLLNHVDEFEQGSLECDDLPNFPHGDKWLQWHSVRFGTMWHPASPPAYVVLNGNTFVGIYGDRRSAEARLADDPHLSAEVVTPTPCDLSGLLTPLVESDAEVPSKLGANFQYLLDDPQRLDAPKDFPEFPATVNWLMATSITFGTWWELTHPALFAVLDYDQQFDSLHSDPTIAEAEAGDDQYVQRVSVIDGDITAAALGEFEDGFIDQYNNLWTDSESV